jgi:modulator of FtsH protease HflK
VLLAAGDRVWHEVDVNQNRPPLQRVRFDDDEFNRVVDDLRNRVWRGRRWIWRAILLVLAIITLLTSYYQIEPEAVGMVTRFGRYVRVANPGPHGKLPFGIERVQKVPVERQLKQEFGFRTTRPGVQSEFGKDDHTQEALMLTGDLNVATVEWIVQYKIADPYKYLFNVRDVEETFRLMSEAAMRQVVGDHNVTELLTIGRESIAGTAKDLLDQLCKLYETGIVVQQLVLQDVDPPEPVRPSFNEVNQAIQERERAINDAWAEYNQEIPRAGGRAEQAIQAAEGFAIERVNRAQGEAQRFRAMQEEYAKSPEVTRTRLYLETMSDVLPLAGKKLLIDDKSRGVLPLLDLGKPNVAKEVKP